MGPRVMKPRVMGPAVADSGEVAIQPMKTTHVAVGDSDLHNPGDSGEVAIQPMKTKHVAVGDSDLHNPGDSGEVAIQPMKTIHVAVGDSDLHNPGDSLITPGDNPIKKRKRGPAPCGTDPLFLFYLWMNCDYFIISLNSSRVTSFSLRETADLIAAVSFTSIARSTKLSTASRFLRSSPA